MSIGPKSLPRRRRRWPWVLAALFVLGLALAGDALWAAATAATALETTRDQLREGASALEEGRLEEATNAFGVAEAHASDAGAALDHPGPMVVGWLPGLGDDLDAVRRLTTAAELSAQAGGSLVQAADSVGWDGGALPGVEPGGDIDADRLAGAEPYLTEAAGRLARASDEVAPVDPAALIEPLRDPATTAKREVLDRAQQADRLAAAAGLVPELLGANGDRRYLMVVMNTSDPRGSGGYPGAYGVLHTDGSRITLEEFRPTNDIPEVPPVDAPEDIVKRWRARGSLTSFWNTTYTPDFPSASRLMLAIWEASGGEPVDGIVAVDPTFMAGLLGAVGPVDTPVWPEQIDAGNVTRIMGADTFRTTSQKESDGWQSAIGSAVWSEMFTRPWPAVATGGAFADAASGGNLQVYSVDAETQEEVVDLGIDGGVDLPTDDSPLVVVQGFTPNRAGYFAQWDTSTSTAERPDGSRIVTVTVTLVNAAPHECPPSILCGLPRDGPLGAFGAEVHVYMPVGAEVISTSTDGGPGLRVEQEEFGRPVVVSYVYAEAQDTSVTIVKYRVPS